MSPRFVRPADRSGRANTNAVLIENCIFDPLSLYIRASILLAYLEKIHKNNNNQRLQFVMLISSAMSARERRTKRNTNEQVDAAPSPRLSLLIIFSSCIQILEKLIGHSPTSLKSMMATRDEEAKRLGQQVSRLPRLTYPDQTRHDYIYLCTLRRERELGIVYRYFLFFFDSVLSLLARDGPAVESATAAAVAHNEGLPSPSRILSSWGFSVRSSLFTLSCR